MLFDEPLGHLDAKLREELKFEIRRIQRESGITAIYVTHDQSEAFAIADYIYVMNRGVVEQQGTPVELYENPQSPFIAEFIGAINAIKGQVLEVDRGSGVAVISAEGIRIKAMVREDITRGDRVVVGVRPEHVRVDREPPKKSVDTNVFTGRVVRKVFLGPYLQLEIDIGYRDPIRTALFGEEKYRYMDIGIGDEVYVSFNKVFVFRSRS